MGIFSGHDRRKIEKIINKANSQAEQKARANGGKCRNCRYYDSFRAFV